MRILVLGRKGQVARSVVEACNARGFNVLAVGRPDLDITEQATIDRAIKNFKPDIMINAAAYTAVDQAEREPEMAFAINRHGAKNAAHAAAAAGIPMVHISTDYVFDGKSPRPYCEMDATAPLNIYGRSKLEGEYAVAEAASDHLILRASWVFSPFGQNFVTTMLRLAKSGTTIRIVDDQIGSPTYALDLAETILDLCASWSKLRLNGLFHVTGTGETSWFGFACQIFQSSTRQGGPLAAVQPVRTVEFPTMAIRPANSRLDCTRFQDATGIRLPQWRDATDRCVARLLRRPEVED